MTTQVIVILSIEDYGGERNATLFAAFINLWLSQRMRHHYQYLGYDELMDIANIRYEPKTLEMFHKLERELSFLNGFWITDGSVKFRKKREAILTLRGYKDVGQEFGYYSYQGNCKDSERVFSHGARSRVRGQRPTLGLRSRFGKERY